MNTKGMIEITGVNMTELVKLCDKLSKPQGMGHLHYQAGDLTDDEANEVIEATGKGSLAVSMDYVRGRAVKMTVFKEGDKLFINNQWFDHNDTHLMKLLGELGVPWQRVEDARKEAAA